MAYTKSDESYSFEWEGYQLPRQNHAAHAEMVVDSSTQVFAKPKYTGWHLGVADGARNNKRVCKLGKSFGVEKCTECTILPSQCPALTDRTL